MVVLEVLEDLLLVPADGAPTEEMATVVFKTLLILEEHLLTVDKVEIIIDLLVNLAEAAEQHVKFVILVLTLEQVVVTRVAVLTQTLVRVILVGAVVEVLFIAQR
jgi:hypothetical protein